MEEIKNKLNTDNLPTLNLEEIAIGKNEKGNYIVPDEVMEKNYRELPNGTVNESGTYTAWNGGLLKSLNEDIRRKGAEALNAERAQRRKLSETIDIMLRKKASAEEIEMLGLEDGATKQDAMIAAMLVRAIEQKDVQAFNSLRDTAGEKPTEKLSAEVTALTPEDKEMLERVSRRLEEL